MMMRLSVCLVLLVWPTLCFGQIQNEPELEAWKAFAKGREILESSGPRSSVLALWKDGLLKDTQSALAQQIAECIPLLERQIEEDKTLAKETVVDPDHLPIPTRIDYYIKRFVDVEGTQGIQPGFCHTVSFHYLYFGEKWWVGDAQPIVQQPTRYSDSIVLIGRPAIPALIEHLNDSRLTRSVGFRNGYLDPSGLITMKGLEVTCDSTRQRNVPVKVCGRTWSTPGYPYACNPDVSRNPKVLGDFMCERCRYSQAQTGAWPNVKVAVNCGTTKVCCGKNAKGQTIWERHSCIYTPITPGGTRQTSKINGQLFPQVNCGQKITVSGINPQTNQPCSETITIIDAGPAPGNTPGKGTGDVDLHPLPAKSFFTCMGLKNFNCDQRVTNVTATI